MRVFSMALLSVLLVFCVGCQGLGCNNNDAQVPFQRPAEHAATDPSPRVFAPKHGKDLPRNTRRVAIEGAPLAIPGSVLHHVFLTELNSQTNQPGRPGKRDALVLWSRRDNTHGLSVAYREAGAWRMEQIAEESLLPDCTVNDADIHRLAPDKITALLTYACEAGARHTVWALNHRDPPRVLEKVVLLPPSEASTDTATIVFRAEDYNQDNRVDLIGTLTLQQNSQDNQDNQDNHQAVTTELRWLDSVGGLSRDRAQPSGTLRELAASARSLFVQGKDGSDEAVQQTLQLHAFFCREAGAPRFQLGDSLGLNCGKSPSQGRAHAVRIATQLAAGDIDTALREMAGATNAVNIADMASMELDEDVLQLGWARVPTVDNAVARSVHTFSEEDRGRARAFYFEDDDHIRLEGSISEEPQRLAMDGTSEVIENFRPATLSPRRLFQATLVRTCSGTSLRIAHYPEDTAINELLVAEPPASGQCSTTADASDPTELPWRLLGWAPQGLVVAQLDYVKVFPVNARGQSAGRPTALLPTALLPAPLLGSLATRAGDVAIEATKQGILVRTRGPEPNTQLVRPEGWTAIEDPVQDAAVAPNGRKAVVHRGDTLWLVTW